MFAQRKLFTAERQLLKGSPKPDGPAADMTELLSAITGFRDEFRETMRERKSEVIVPAPKAPPAPEEKNDEVDVLKTEVRALSIAINQTKMEIGALRPQNSVDDRLTTVNNELDAIVSSTEQATNSILSSSEKIENLANQLRAQSTEGFSGQIADEIRDSVVTIFEACNFQDITGQRITKVIRTLQFIEERVNKMIEIWGPDTFVDSQPKEAQQDADADLLNGPALENQGTSQADIDRMFD